MVTDPSVLKIRFVVGPQAHASYPIELLGQEGCTKCSELVGIAYLGGALIKSKEVETTPPKKKEME